MEPTPANTLTLITIQVHRPPFNFQGLSKLTVMKMINPCNDPAYLMHM